MVTFFLAIVVIACLIAAAVWGRSASYRFDHMRRVERDVIQEDDSEATARRKQDAQKIARTNFLKETHAAVLYFFLAVASAAVAFTNNLNWATLYLLVAAPALVSALWWGRESLKDALLLRERFDIEVKAEETLSQAESAPKAWAERLSPEKLEKFAGFETGRVYQAGSGLMAGDFYDIYQVSPTRTAAVLGDVSGHGVESAITAFLAKFLLRILLLEYRDPAQAIQELHKQMYLTDRPEEFISMVVLMFDTEAETFRYASAGHPTVWLWHEQEAYPLRRTGPLVMLEKNASYYSREIPLHPDDTVVLYSDGLTEARRETSPDEMRGAELFGEDRVAQLMRNDPTMHPQQLCELLRDEAQKFARGSIDDDLSIFAVRWTGEPEDEEQDEERL